MNIPASTFVALRHSLNARDGAVQVAALPQISGDAIHALVARQRLDEARAVQTLAQELPGGPAQALAGVDLLGTSAQRARTDIAVMYGEIDDLKSYPHFMAEISQIGAHGRIMGFNEIEFDRAGRLVYQGRSVPTPEAVITRSVNEHGLEVLERLKAQDVHIVNDADELREGLGKVGMAQVAARDGGTDLFPEQYVVSSLDELQEAAGKLGLPTVIKSDEGSGSSGVWLARSEADLVERGAPLAKAGGPFVAQKYIQGANQDIRMHFVRGLDDEMQLVAAFKRAGNHDFYSNGPAGNTRTRVAIDGSDPDLTPVGIETGKRAAELSRRANVGIDLMPNQRQIAEWNGTPGTTELEAPFPRSEHTIPRMVEYAALGQQR